MGELHPGPKHPLSGVDTESYFDLHVVPPESKPKGEGDCGYLVRYSLVYAGRVGLVSLGQLPTWEKGTPIIIPWVGEVRQPCWQLT